MATTAQNFQNPYYAVASIRDPAMFFGQDRVLRRLYPALIGHQCISLVGWPHFGKTSILRCISLPEMQERFACDLSRHILVFIDLGAHLQKPVEDFFEIVCKEIVAKSRGRLDISLPSETGADKFSAILTQIVDQGFHTVLLIDSFDDIALNKHFDSEFLAFLRSQAMMHNVVYITASIASVYDICHQGGMASPFFNIFGTIHLEPFTLDEARALIITPADKAGLSFTEAEVAWVLKHAGRHPFFIQRVCYFFFEEKSHSHPAEPNRKRVRDLAYTELQSHFEDTWMHLTEQQHELLKFEAQRPGMQQRKLPELSESVLFRAFVRRKCQVTIFQMTTDDIEGVLDKFDDVRFLGDSKLRYLKIVSMRVKNESVSSTIERGKVMREVLNEAFEGLRGTGVRRDTEPEWRLYNILYYRYFKYHLKNDQVAARLEFSTRQYFRERIKAIEALYNNLLEMEALCNEEDED